MKTIATIAASLVLSVGVMTSPAFAEEPAPAACSESEGREVLLGYEIEGLEQTIEIMNRDLVRAERKIDSQAATIARLRAKLARR